MEEALLGVVICLLPSGTDPQAKATPVGVIHMKPLVQPASPHRFSEIGIDILKGFQGKGYGTEAIQWALEWAFEVVGLHRVEIRAFGWNTGARKLYEKIGFKHEGIHRELLWHNGRWWDDYEFGMLDREWRAMQKDKSQPKSVQ